MQLQRLPDRLAQCVGVLPGNRDQLSVIRSAGGQRLHSRCCRWLLLNQCNKDEQLQHGQYSIIARLYVL